MHEKTNNETSFKDDATTHLDRLGNELTELENKLVASSNAADAWSRQQVAKLKDDLEKARDDAASIAGRIQAEGEDAVDEVKAQAERHWQALQAAVTSYRSHLEKSAGQ